MNDEMTNPIHTDPGESRLRSIFAHASVGFAVSTTSGRLIEVNPKFCEITGYTKSMLLEMSIAELMHPEDRSRDQEAFAQLTGGKTSHFTIEKRFLKRDGSVAWVRNSVSLVKGADDENLVMRVAEDVTAQREADRLRHESEQQYVRLADSMPQIVWTANPQGSLDYFNKVWFEYSGSDYEENVGSGWTKFVHADDLGRTAENWRRSVQTGAMYENEFRLKSKDGSYRWHFARAVPDRAENGTIVKWYGTNTDIHETISLTRDLDLARRAVEAEQQKFRTIFADSSTSMAVLKGTDFEYEVANASYKALFNHRDIVGKKFTDALPELIGQEFPSLAASVLSTGKPYIATEAKAYLSRTDGSPVEERYFDQSYTQMRDLEDRPYGVFIHAVEVTDRVEARRELEEAAERFRIAIETANMGTWDYYPQTNKVRWSERTKELFGVSEGEAITLEAATKNIHPDDKQRVLDAITAAIDPKGNGDYQIEYRTLPPEGDVLWLSILGKTFFTETEAGRVATRFSGTVLDVTDRVLNEIALRDAKERAEMASAAKSAFLANMSHEIRTPLGAIMGFVGLMRDEGVTPKMQQEFVAVIERNSTQLMRIIDDILDLSKVEAGMMLIEHIDFALVELLSDFASLMGFRARDKGVLFELKAKSQLPEIINSDPTRIRQILTNIVGNAIKFTENGTVRLLVSFSENIIEFEVEDTGKGISAQQAEQLFQPFSQGDISTTRRYGGTGLGLVLTRRLSEAMGGNFALKRSEEGVGSVFTATVRVKVPPNSQLVNSLGFASEAIRNAGVQNQLQNVKILLVEDSPDNQNLFSIYLNRAGASVDIASDGAQGFSMAMSENYDVVLMDVQMPVMDGITTVRKLRESGYAKPIVALTAHAMKEERVRCLEAGFTDFLSKPVQRPELVDLLFKYADLVRTGKF